MDDHFYAVIMAGGEGTRLWPLSRRLKPKQSLRFAKDRSLFQMAVDRLEGLLPADRILVVTIEEQAKELQNQCPQIPQENFFMEPMPRGTASVIGLAATVLKYRDPQAIMVVLTADHFIRNQALFHQLLRAAVDVAKEDYLVTLGIKPEYAATGYGYIQMGKQIGVYQGIPVYEASHFKEKPVFAEAQKMIDSGDHVWNSGMFVWKAGKILDELQLWMPHLYGILWHIGRGLERGDFNETLRELWASIKPETIDYGVMEKARRVVVVPSTDLGWNDVGSWDSLFDVLTPDSLGNILIDAQHIGMNSEKTLVCADDYKRLIVTIGTRELIIVDTKDALLVCTKEEAQQVRKLVNFLKQTGLSSYL